MIMPPLQFHCYQHLSYHTVVGSSTSDLPSNAAKQGNLINRRCLIYCSRLLCLYILIAVRKPNHPIKISLSSFPLLINARPSYPYSTFHIFRSISLLLTVTKTKKLSLSLKFTHCCDPNYSPFSCISIPILTCVDTASCSRSDGRHSDCPPGYCECNHTHSPRCGQQ